MSKRFLFTCGGTAGHINPAVGVAGRIKEIYPDAEILFVGAEGKMETRLVPQEGYDIKTVRITSLMRSFSPAGIKHNIQTAKNVVNAKKEAKKIIKEFKPDAAIGTGGYVCYPVLKAASGMGIPTVVHESNAVPGLTTKMLSKFVDRVMVGFPESKEQYKDPSKVVVTGTPVRRGFKVCDKEQAKAELGYPTDKPLVVSVWGSLGAGYMNDVMVDFISRLCKDESFTLVHSAGTRYFEDMSVKLDASGCADRERHGVDVREYIYDMPKVMAAADLVMCRSGASTIGELEIMGKPVIMVPSPNVTNNHQEKNARVLEKAGAAIVFLEGGFTSDELFECTKELISNKEELEKMSCAMKGLAVEDSTERIVDIVLGLLKE